MPDNNLFGVDFIARCIAGEGLETANKRQWKLQAGPRILLSDNPETQTTTISATGEDITVDDALSTTSENPVQNKVITNELLTKPTCVLPNGTKVNNQNIMQLTRAQYDAIQNKDPNTYYMVTGDSENAVFYRTAYVDMMNDYTSEMSANGDWVLTFELEDTDFEKLDVYLQFQFDWTAGSDWATPNTTKRSIMLSLTKGVTEPVYSNTMNIYLANTINSTSNPHFMGLYDLLIGSVSLTYDETTHIVTMQINKPLMDAVNDPNETKNNYPVAISNCIAHAFGYVAYGSDNINITTDSYTAGTGISIDANHAISLAANYATNIEATIDPDTYVITLRLRDQNGIYIGTAQTIDLPLESVVVSGTYDDTTKKIILTLENGQTIEFSVADLVSGLETSAHAASTYLTQNDAANTYATQLAVSSLKTVPAVTSSDDGKILTADYTGGVGSYSWTNPQTFSQQQADWAETDTTAVDYIQNKPTLAAVATSGNYSDLSGKPNLATVATSGDYDDLTNKPTIPAAQVNADWNASSGVAEILNKPDLSNYATTSDISDMATQTWVGQQGFLDSSDVAPVATSGDYDDLTNKPTLGTAAAADTTDFATAAQGAKADTAVQPAAIADMATETWVGQQGFLTDADEVPAVGSSDDGKVLTASYSGGTGSYSWQPASGGGGGLQVETDGTNYWITVNGIRLYFASSAPTGTIPNGSLGIGW